MFRRETKNDTFDRQMDALRGQLGDEPLGDEPAAELEAEPVQPVAAPAPGAERLRDYGFAAAIGQPVQQQGQTGQAPQQSQPAQRQARAFPEFDAPDAPEVPEVDARTTVVAADAQWKGDIVSEGSVHIHGRFDGSVRAKVAIFVAEGAQVDAQLASDSIVVAGSTKGSIRAERRFEALPSGRVAGDIVSPTLVVHEGATIAGQLRMSPAEAVPEVAAPTPVVQRRAARGTA